jgi:hypothetical protein
MESRMKEFRRGVVFKKRSCPTNWKYSDFKASAMKNSNCPDLESFLISFDYHSKWHCEIMVKCPSRCVNFMPVSCMSLKWILSLICFCVVEDKKETFLPKKKSGFSQLAVANGVLQKIYYYREPHGLHCQNPTHLGSAAALDVERDFCERCVHSGGNYTNQSIYWTLPELIYIPSTCSIFLWF